MTMGVIFLGFVIFCVSTFQQVHGQVPGQMPGQMYGQMPGQMYGQMPGQMFGQVPGQMPGRLSDQMGVPLGRCGMRASGSCYGTGYDRMRKVLCCNGDPYYPCPGSSRWACCGKVLVDRNLYSCCNNDPILKVPGMTCCDKYLMNPMNSVCCDGEIRPKLGPNTYCCNKKSYDHQHYLCCSKDIVLKVNAIYNVACDPGNDAQMSFPPPRGEPVSGPGHVYGSPTPSHGVNNGPPPSPGFNSAPPSSSFKSQTTHRRTTQPKLNQPAISIQQGQNANPELSQTPTHSLNRSNPQTMNAQPYNPFKLNMQALKQMLKSFSGSNPTVG